MQAQQAPALPYVKVAGRPALEATQHHPVKCCFAFHIII